TGEVPPLVPAVARAVEDPRGLVDEPPDLLLLRVVRVDLLDRLPGDRRPGLDRLAELLELLGRGQPVEQVERQIQPAALDRLLRDLEHGAAGVAAGIPRRTGRTLRQARRVAPGARRDGGPDEHAPPELALEVPLPLVNVLDQAEGHRGLAGQE